MSEYSLQARLQQEMSRTFQVADWSPYPMVLTQHTIIPQRTGLRGLHEYDIEETWVINHLSSRPVIPDRLITRSTFHTTADTSMENEAIRSETYTFTGIDSSP